MGNIFASVAGVSVGVSVGEGTFRKVAARNKFGGICAYGRG